MNFEPSHSLPIATPATRLTMTSPSSSPTSSTSSTSSASPRFILSPSASISSSFSVSSRSSISSDFSSRCAFPSWPSGSSLSPINATFSTPETVPNAFISDDDLLPDGADVRDYLTEPPPPPREPSAYLAAGAGAFAPREWRKPLSPVGAIVTPTDAGEKMRKRRRSSRKQKREAVAMTPIAESPEDGSE